MVLGGGTWDFLRVSCRPGMKNKNISFCIPADAMPDPADDTERETGLSWMRNVPSLKSNVARQTSHSHSHLEKY